MKLFLFTIKIISITLIAVENYQSIILNFYFLLAIKKEFEISMFIKLNESLNLTIINFSLRIIMVF